jgi:multidrug efflux pump subunit AcrA (membrane-fusion protein)
MIKRFVIAAVIVGLFLGGVAYFNLVFKPKMIADFMSKMVPPPATVTAEIAKSEDWIDRLRAIGTLVAIQGVDVAPQLGGMVTDYYFDSGKDVEKGEKLVKLDTSVEEADLADNKATLNQANLDYERQVNGARVFVVIAQTPSDGRSPEKAWNFYFAEVDGKIYSLTLNTPVAFSSQLAAEGEKFLSSLPLTAAPTSPANR